jgi:hypothetical protein
MTRRCAGTREARLARVRPLPRHLVRGADARGVGCAGRCAAEHQPVMAVLGPSVGSLVLQEVRAKLGRDRDCPGTCLAFRGDDLVVHGVVRTLDSDGVRRQVDVFPAEGPQLAPTQTRVYRRGPKRAVLDDEDSKQLGRFHRRGVRSRCMRTAGRAGPAVGLTATRSSAMECRQIARRGTIVLRTVAGLAPSMLMRETSRCKSARRMSSPVRSEHGEQAEPQRLVVSAESGRLVGVAGAIANLARASAGKTRLSRLPEGRSRLFLDLLHAQP